MRVLGVVLFAVLLCFFNSAAASNCTDAGIEHTTGHCVCDSGYYGAECELTFADGACLAKAVDPIVATFFPKLNDTLGATTFTHNHLKASILNPQVEGRRFLELNFIGATDPRCSFGTADSFWSKEVFTGETDDKCGDRFSLDLPWSAHQLCNFQRVVAETTDSSLKIQGGLMIKYQDPLEIEGEDLVRIVSVPYKMAVTFPRTINVTLLTLNITSDVHFGVALTSDEFEPNNQTLTLQLTTIINFPNVFHMAYTQLYHPDHVYALPGKIPDDRDDRTVYVVPEVTLATPECPLASGPCTQRWNIQLRINDTVAAGTENNCTFDGNYTVQYRLYTCRGVTSNPDELDCTYSLTNVTFSISTSNVCGQVDVKPEVTGKLLAIPASHQFEEFDNFELIRSSAKTRFALGQFAKFYADIASDGNDITIVFEEIKMIKRTEDFPSSTDAVPADAVWTTMYNRASPAAVTHPHMSKANVTVSDAHKGFQIYFHSSVFTVAPEATESFVISALATITFLGNEGETKKRTIEYTFEQNAARANANVGLSNGVKATPNNEVAANGNGINQLTFIASVVGAVAGTLIIVFVVVGVVLRSRNSEARDSAASPAVSAANAAAATIEVINRA